MSASVDPRRVQIFDAALRALPPPGHGGGYHAAILGCANRGIRAGLSAGEVADAIRAHTRSGGRHVSDGEIESAVQKAASESGKSIGRPKLRAPVPRFNAADALSNMLLTAAGITEADVWEASPIRIDWERRRDAIRILEHLYAPDDVLYIGDDHGRQVRWASAWIQYFKTTGSVPPLVIPNPLTGEIGTTKDGKASYRADGCVKSFLMAVAESDTLSIEDQLRFWWACDIPVRALIHSGGKSVHAWIAVDDVSTATEWSDQVENQLFRHHLIPLGFDKTFNESRLSRMPGHFRAQKGEWQRILFLAPEGRRVRP